MNLSATQLIKSLFSLLGILLGVAALAASTDGVRIQMRQESEETGDEKQNTDWQRLTLQNVIESSDAVVQRRTNLQLIEVEEQTWVADTVAAEFLFKLSRKLFKAIANLSNFSLVVRILAQLCQLQVIQILVTVPEVIKGSGSSSCVYEERQVCIDTRERLVLSDVSRDSEVSLEFLCSTISEGGIYRLV